MPTLSLRTNQSYQELSADHTYAGDFKKDQTILKTEWESLYRNSELNQIITEPTCVTDKTATLIDHMYCSTDLSVINHVVVKCGLSDHFPIIGVFNVKSPGNGHMNSHTTIAYRKFKSINYDTLISDLTAAPWNLIDLDHYTTDECVQTFNSLLLDILNAHAPIIARRINRQAQAKWMTPDMFRMLCIKEIVQRQYK